MSVPESQLVRRGQPEPPHSRGALVRQLQAKVRADKAHFIKPFQRMREDMRFAEGEQWPANSKGYYVANVVKRHIQQRVATLYAKNPKVQHRLYARMDNTAWDGEASSLREAEQLNQLSMEQTGQPEPNSLAILQDYLQYQQRKEMLKRVGKSMEYLLAYYMREQTVPFKSSMKALVRRAVTTGVGYVVLDFQRATKLRPDVEQRIGDMTERLAYFERLAADMTDDLLTPDSPEAESLRLGIQALQQENEILVREGLVFDFPKSTSIIPDRKCTSLNGFVGADWLTREYMMSVEDIHDVYDVDVGKQYREYRADREHAGDTLELPLASRNSENTDRGLALVWEMFDRKSGLVYTMAEGYGDFLTEPVPPTVRLERFWPVFTLMFNEGESDSEIYPLSDARLLRDMQLDYNRARQGLREHRRANRPKIVTAAGALDKSDRDKLQTHPANAVIELNSLIPGQDVEKLLQPMRMPGIDPNIYDTSPQFDDVLKVVGAQEANLGGTSSRTTATETSVAESSRLTTTTSSIDELDELLNVLVQEGGKVMLAELSQETVVRLVGRGAVWPKWTREQINAELFLSVEAGSSGKPNQTQQIQNYERLMPLLLQIPGLNPEFLAQEGLRRLDDRLELAEALQLGMPSIVALNGIQQQVDSAGAGAGNSPSEQGGQGASNAPAPGGVPGNAATGPGLPQLPVSTGVDVAR